MGIGIQRVGHVVLKVRDLEVAKEFYTGALGMQIASESDRAIFFRFGTYHHDLAVFKVTEEADPPKEDQVGLLHVALVADSLDTIKRLNRDLRARGVNVRGALDHGFTKSLYITDPEGNQIEIYAEAPDFDYINNNDYINNLSPLDLETEASQ